MKTKTISIISSLIGISIGALLISFSEQMGREAVIISGTYIIILCTLRAIEDIIRDTIKKL